MLLLDTHVVLWLAREPERLSVRAVQAISEARTSAVGVGIAAITLFEIALLAAKNKLTFHSPLELLLQKVEQTYTVVPMTAKVAVAAMKFSPPYPNDPADRQIGATALVHGLTLITADPPILRSGQVPCIW